MRKSVEELKIVMASLKIIYLTCILFLLFLGKPQNNTFRIDLVRPWAFYCASLNIDAFLKKKQLSEKKGT